jgi:mono/diheme cytochrome c family protein
MSKRRIWVLALFTLAASGCFYPKSAPPPASVTAAYVDAAKRRDAAADEALLERGRSIFAESCGECHDHPDLSAIALKEWPSILEAMSDKADLDAAKAAELKTFVLAAAEAMNAPQD